MKDLLKTNCFDTKETMLIVGSCLKDMFPNEYNKLKEQFEVTYDVCLEETHLNMVVTKLIGMISRRKIKRLAFASVDKSPHCIQLHYTVKELENAVDLRNIEIENYVVSKEKGIQKISLEIISLSKNLSKLKEKLENN